jgi:response regulator NasT
MLAKSTAKRRVLLVDDEPLILATIGQVLRNAGYETAEAASGEDALKVAQEFDPDLALLDVIMSGMTGLELAKRLQAETDIPFMFISANAEVEIVKQASEYGAVGYLLKPFDIAQIIPAFEAALGRADEIRRLRSSEANLTIALNSGRETSMAVGLLMAKFGSDRHTAFEVLRAYSRSNRCKMNEVAEDLLAAEEMFNSFNALFSKQSGAQ